MSVFNKINIRNIIHYENDNILKNDNGGDAFWKSRSRIFYSLLFKLILQNKNLVKDELFNLNTLYNLSTQYNQESLEIFIETLPGFNKNMLDHNQSAYEQFGYLLMYDIELFYECLNPCLFHLEENNLTKVRDFFKFESHLNSVYKTGIFKKKNKKYFAFLNGIYSFDTGYIWIIDQFVCTAYDFKSLEKKEILLLGNKLNIDKENLKHMKNRVNMFNKMNITDIENIINTEMFILDGYNIEDLSDDEFEMILEMKYAF